MAMRRRSPYGGYKKMEKHLERKERRELQRTMGQWYNVNENKTIVVGPTKKGDVIVLPKNPGSGIKTEFYAFDLLLSLSVTGPAGGSGVVNGAIGVAHIRHGQAITDFVGVNGGLPVGLAGGQEARFRSYLPFVLSQTVENSQALAVIPYRPFRGFRIQLLAQETLGFAIMLAQDTVNGIGISFAMAGRYRFLVPA